MNGSRRSPSRSVLARRLAAGLISVLVLAAVISAADRDRRVAGTSLAAAAEAIELDAPPAPHRSEAPPRPARVTRAARGKAKRCVDPKRIAAARRWASDRTAEVSFAVLDECGRLVGDHRYRTHYSASVVKVMLLAAYLRQPSVRDRGLDGGERDLLGAMIKISDNDAADSVYSIVGAEGLLDLARRADMRSFTTMPSWGGSTITAGDQARFVGRLERYVPRRHERYALGLMARVIGSQRWGIPQLELPGWNVHLKGGWSPQESGGGWRVNQVAVLTRGERRLSLAILTSDDPDFLYGQETIEGVAKRLLLNYRAR